MEKVYKNERGMTFLFPTHSSTILTIVWQPQSYINTQTLPTFSPYRNITIATMRTFAIFSLLSVALALPAVLPLTTRGEISELEAVLAVTPAGPVSREASSALVARNDNIYEEIVAWPSSVQAFGNSVLNLNIENVGQDDSYSVTWWYINWENGDPLRLSIKSEDSQIELGHGIASHVAYTGTFNVKKNGDNFRFVVKPADFLRSS